MVQTHLTYTGVNLHYRYAKILEENMKNVEKELTKPPTSLTKGN